MFYRLCFYFLWTYGLYKHLSKKTLIFLLFSWRTALTSIARNFYRFIWRALIIWIKFHFRIFSFIRFWVFSYWPNEDSDFTPQFFIFLNFFFLFSLLGTSVKYFFPLISSKYLFTLLKIRYKGFTVLIFTYFEYLIVTYSI